MKQWTWPKERAAVEAFFSEVEETPRAIEERVDAVIDAVRRRGDEALAEFTERFDQVKLAPGEFAVPVERLRAAWAAAPAGLKKALRTAKGRIEAFHKTQRLKGWTIRDKAFGRIDQRVLPLDRVAVYVPAGEAPLVSTVLMDVIPAQIAGVREIILLSPPKAGGWPDPGIMATAHLLGVKRVFRVGGAQAVAAAAYGTASIPRVDKVVGPGNPYVTTAKQRLYGRIDIESTAGVSEVLILADETARLDYIAADMLAQAEHSGNNPVGVVLIGGGARRAKALEAEVERQLARLSRSELAARSVHEHGYIICARTADQAVELANMKAPEHLEIMAEGARKMADGVRHAGAIFLGAWTPESVGDYVAGPNHTLPTSGTARFFSPLSVWAFYKTSHMIEASRAGLAALAGDIVTLAEAEGLTAHAQAARVRLD